MKRTSLYETHLSLGARVVDFAGWEMPLQYPTGINQEHLAVRSDAGIFDVSHMGEIRILGERATGFLRYATLNDPAKLRPGRGQYSMLPNNQGGLVDDLYVYCEAENEYLIICNAANIGPVVGQLKDLARAFDCHVVNESDSWALIALQGPGAALIASRVSSDPIVDLKKNRFLNTEISACPVKLARTGYTGEDGFEVLCHPTDAPIVWNVFTDAGALPCGLGARDTLRLEAGFPLFGQEFDATTNPLCSDYAWVVKDKDFYGREHIWGKPCQQKLVGLKMSQRGVARHGYRVFAQEQEIGKVSSGTISPLTREGIALAWIDAEFAVIGQSVAVEIRGQHIPATVVKPPFHL